jgi:hypothetical protein
MATKIDIMKDVLRGMEALAIDSRAKVATQNIIQDDTLPFANTNDIRASYLYAYGTPTHTAFSRVITGFNGIPTIQVAPSWGTASVPTINQTYMIIRGYKADDIQHTVKRAMQEAGKWHFPNMVGTIAAVASQYEYSVPSGFLYVNNMHFVPTSGSDTSSLDYYEIPRNVWTIEGKKIVFDPRYIDLGIVENRYIRIFGQGKPPPLDNDHDTYDDLLENYLIAYSIRELYRRRIGEGTEYLRKYNAMREIVAEEEQKISTGIAANAVRVL